MSKEYDSAATSGRLPKLRGRENYKVWAHQIETFIDGIGAWEITTGEEEGPTRPRVPQSSHDEGEDAEDNFPVSSNELKQYNRDMKEYKTELRDWKSRHSKAKTAITVNCTESIQQLLTEFSTAHEIWTFLKGQYGGSGPAQRLEAYTTWSTMEFDGKSLQKFTEDYQASLRKIDNFKMQLGKELRVYDFIGCITPYYSTWADIKRDSLRHITFNDTATPDDQLPSIEDLVKDLLDHDAEMKRQDKLNLTFKAQSNSKPKLFCNHCKKTGHTEDRCYQKHGKPDGRGKKDKGKSPDGKPNPGFTFVVQPKHKLVRHTTHNKDISTSDEWCYDSGSGYHCTNDLADLKDYHPVDAGVRVGDNRPLKGYYMGYTEMELVAPNGSTTPVKFTNVLYVPQLGAKLISEQLLREKHGVFYNGRSMTLFKINDDGSENHFATLKDRHGLPHLVIERKRCNDHDSDSDSDDRKSTTALYNSSRSIKSTTVTAAQLHARFGHLSDDALRHLDIDGVKVKGNLSHGICDACKQGSFKKKHSRKSATRPEKVFEELSIDVVTNKYRGPGGERYMTLSTDGKSLFRHEYSHAHKSHAGIKILHLLQHIERSTGCIVQRLRLDNGNEFAEVKHYCERKGIRILPSTPHNSQQNGRAEVSNYLVEKTARTMMIAGKVPRHLWTYAVSTAVQMLNFMPSRTLGYKSPLKMLEEIGFTGPVNLAHLKAYGCRAYVYDEHKARADKFSSRVGIGKLVGYERGAHNIYYIYVPSLHKVVRSSNVDFDESRFDCEEDDAAEGDAEGMEVDFDSFYDAPSGGEKDSIEEPASKEPAPFETESIDTGMPEPGYRTTPPRVTQQSSPRYDVEDSRSDDDSTASEQLHEPASREPVQSRRSGRTATQSDKAHSNEEQGLNRYGQKHKGRLNMHRRLHRVFMASINGIVHNKASSIKASDISIPNTYDEAMASPQAPQWHTAMQQEVDSLKANNTWELVKLTDVPHDANIIRGRWVFTIKADANGNPVRYKARWVARGFTQKHGVDYEDTYATVTKPATVKVMLSIVAANDLECQQFDLITAFLNALIQKFKIFIEQPHGFEIFFDDERLVCLLLRALYGLKQSPLLWYDELTSFLRSIGLAPTISDPCLFIHPDTGAYILIYVDDLLIMATTTAIIDQITSLLEQRFPLKKLGDVAWFLGCRIIRDRKARLVWVLQDAYIAHMAEKFGIKLRKRLTPSRNDMVFRKGPEGYTAPKKLRHHYQELVGSLMWPAQITRGDAALIVSKLAMYLTNPTQEHLDAAEHCAEYLLYNKSDGICLGANDNEDPLHLEGFVDASYADNVDDRRSTAGLMFKFGRGPIFWKSGRQSLVTLSTTEAEYVAMTQAAKEAVFLKRLTGEILHQKQEPVVIHEDNQPAIDLLKRPSAADSRTKHIDVRYHFIRQEVERGSIAVVKIGTDLQAADGLTKPLDKIKHERFKVLFGIVNCQQAMARVTR
ncbi:hypothetical protein KC343_g10664 [Hortaea werneckii]|nr:hypothetical protein KC361_g9505 [Hortaea werneckii]KAI7199976.1 hypothetical protein KC352_g19797 [Hortaea werneckii]KAI7204253.1 hypothetical protein KC365_g18034 [Hortaea werneckii]KAI7558708.1 hypothetical protein KC317_g10838 [Hortaea werneckii]KAI7606401.1 hypothetical protein KC346_g10561 [Hortaea werneckii]